MPFWGIFFYKYLESANIKQQFQARDTVRLQIVYPESEYIVNVGIVKKKKVAQLDKPQRTPICN